MIYLCTYLLVVFLIIISTHYTYTIESQQDIQLEERPEDKIG